MVLLIWHQGLETGIQEVDREHRQLLDCVNVLHDLASAEPKDEAGIESVIVGLRDRAARHFAKEEAWLEQRASPHLDTHRMLHEILLADLDGIIDTTRRDGFNFLAEDLEGALRHWLIEHIVNVDKKLLD